MEGWKSNPALLEAKGIVQWFREMCCAWRGRHAEETTGHGQNLTDDLRYIRCKRCLATRIEATPRKIAPSYPRCASKLTQVKASQLSSIYDTPTLGITHVSNVYSTHIGFINEVMRDAFKERQVSKGD